MCHDIIQGQPEEYIQPMWCLKYSLELCEVIYFEKLLLLQTWWGFKIYQSSNWKIPFKSLFDVMLKVRCTLSTNRKHQPYCFTRRELVLLIILKEPKIVFIRISGNLGMILFLVLLCKRHRFNFIIWIITEIDIGFPLKFPYLDDNWERKHFEILNLVVRPPGLNLWPLHFANHCMKKRRKS